MGTTAAPAARLVLPPAPQSSGAARRFCAQQLADIDGDALDTVMLLVSELVTNAVLHALTDIEVTVTRRGSWLRVDVRDRSPLLPTQREYGATAVTGRGLGLVELLAAEYGVEPRPGGKSVWFGLLIGDQANGPEEPPSLVVEEQAPPSEGESGDEVPVVLRGLPRRLYQVLQEQNDALLREYALLRMNEAGEPQLSDAPGAPDQAAAERAQGRLASAVAADVTEGSGEHLDVVFTVPRGQLGDFEQLRAVLGETVVLAARGQLLARPALPELRALRTWCLDQVAAAAVGERGSTWVGDDEVEDDDLALPLPAFDASAALDPQAAMLAADDGNRIMAVTPRAAELLGWAPDELVGRRLVTIIPPRLREAHVASFTRLLLSGQPRLLDQSLHLPARCRDGSEVELQVLITGVPVGHGRLVFVAEFTSPGPGTAAGSGDLPAGG